MVAKLSEASEEKQKEAERALEALRNTRAEELGRLGQREAEIKRLRETGHEEGARSRVRIAELEKENRLLKEEQESLRTVQQIRNEDFDKARAELELEVRPGHWRGGRGTGERESGKRGDWGED